VPVIPLEFDDLRLTDAGTVPMVAGWRTQPTDDPV